MHSNDIDFYINVRTSRYAGQRNTQGRMLEIYSKTTAEYFAMRFTIEMNLFQFMRKTKTSTVGKYNLLNDLPKITLNT